MLSVVVPARDAASFLRESLPPLRASLPPGAELIVCDDGSRDDTAQAAQALGARVLRSERPRGPAAARNQGARAARGAIVVFLDADVVVQAETLERLVAPLATPAVGAAFGSYDASPRGRSWISLYKNLSHHFVHQRSREDASTFWAGCGAVRREVLLALGGFDESYKRPSIEDVELGYRLGAAGHAVRLVRDAQVTHLKQWTLGGWLASDLRDRAIPWARLLRAGRGLPRDLNFTPRDRLASGLVAAALAALAAAPWAPSLALGAGGAAAAGLACDAPLLAFLARRVSLPFAAAAAGLQLAHRVAGLAGLLIGFLTPGPARRR